MKKIPRKVKGAGKRGIVELLNDGSMITYMMNLVDKMNELLYAPQSLGSAE